MFVTDEAVVGAEGAVTDEGAPESGGELTEGATGVAGETSHQEPELFSVHVGGKEEKVTFDDLQKGFMRQADYTRKTQELAREREQVAQMQLLAQALERDPRTTLVTLASALGVDLGTAANVMAQAVQGEADPLDLVNSKLDRLTTTFTAQQQATQQAAQQQAQQAAFLNQIEAETSSLKGQYGDFNEKELYQYAVDNGIVGLAPAYRAWQFDLSEQRKADERNRALMAKRQAQVVQGGDSPASGSVAPSTRQHMSVREAVLAAYQAHNQ